MKTVTTKSPSKSRKLNFRTAGISIFCFLLSALHAGDIPLAWNYPAPPPDLGGFRLYYGRAGTTTTNVIMNLPKTQLTFTVTNLPPATYWFYATAVTTNNLQSDPSNLVIASIPAAPGALSIPPQP